MKKKIFLVFVLVLLGAFVSSAYASMSPNINVSLATYSPLPAEPGKPVTVWVNVQNIGLSASNIVVELEDSPSFTLLNERDRVKEIPVLGSYNDYLIKYELFVAENTPEGSRDLLVNVKMDGASSVLRTRLPIDIKSAEAPISVSSVSLNPEILVPGKKSKLTVAVRNLAKSTNVRDVQVSLYLDPIIASTTIVADIPFVTTTSNRKSTDRIAPGQTSEFSFELLAYPDAESKIYKLPVIISYKDDSGNNYSLTYMVGVQVNSKPELLLNVDSSSISKSLRQGEVVFSVVNKGVNNLKLMSITLNEGEGYEVTDTSNMLYIGKLDSDDFETAKFNVKVSPQTSVVNYNITLDYRDALNNEFSDNRNVEYVLRESVNGNGGNSLITIVVMLVLAAGIFVWFRKRKIKAIKK